MAASESSLPLLNERCTSLLRAPNDLYCVELDVKLYYTYIHTYIPSLVYIACCRAKKLMLSVMMLLCYAVGNEHEVEYEDPDWCPPAQKRRTNGKCFTSILSMK